MTEQGGQSGVSIGHRTAQINRLINVIFFVFVFAIRVHLEDFPILKTIGVFCPIRSQWTSTLVCLCVRVPKLLFAERFAHIFPNRSWTNTPHIDQSWSSATPWPDKNSCCQEKIFPHNFPIIFNYYQARICTRIHTHTHKNMHRPAIRQTARSQMWEILHTNMLQSVLCSAMKWFRVFFLFFVFFAAEWHNGLSPLKLNAIQHASFWTVYSVAIYLNAI